MNTSWWFKANRESILSNPKSQLASLIRTVSEIPGFYGSDPNPYDLGGEVELYLDGEPYILTKSTMVFIPPNLRTAPYLSIASTGQSSTSPL